MDWFTVDKAGLAKLLERKGKAFALFELIQNAWDTQAKRVEVSLMPVEGRPYADIEVRDDDPEGFKTLSHAFTLFAESEKKGDPTKRGRFNLGEKLVLALCDRAEILSTKGSVVFDDSGRRETRSHIVKGSIFKGRIRMTRAELSEVEREIQTLIPPDDVETVYNGIPLSRRSQVASKEFSLPTEVADAEGVLRRSVRLTTVTIHEVRDGERGMLYEMGIPVVELGGGERWHINVHQKVPLNVDRDNVTPAYLQSARVVLAECVKDLITRDDAEKLWVTAATNDDRIDPEVVTRVLDERFGKKRAIFDPSDMEANKALMNEGYTIIHGGSLLSGQWDNLKTHGLARPAGQIKPSGVRYDVDGRPEHVIDPDKYTLGQRSFVEYVQELGMRLLNREVQVRIVSEITRPNAAWFGGGTVTFNLGRLGRAWFENGIQDAHHRLIIHEFAHNKVDDHLTREFSDEVCRLAVKLAREMYVDPEFFKRSGYRP